MVIASAFSSVLYLLSSVWRGRYLTVLNSRSFTYRIKIINNYWNFILRINYFTIYLVLFINIMIAYLLWRDSVFSRSSFHSPMSCWYFIVLVCSLQFFINYILQVLFIFLNNYYWNLFKEIFANRKKSWRD